MLFVSSVAWLGITRPQASLPRGHPHPQSAKVEAHIFLGGDFKFFPLSAGPQEGKGGGEESGVLGGVLRVCSEPGL